MLKELDAVIADLIRDRDAALDKADAAVFEINEVRLIGYANGLTDAITKLQEAKVDILDAVLRQMVRARNSTHLCHRCQHPYSPTGTESEDCPVCGHNGVGDA